MKFMLYVSLLLGTLLGIQPALAVDKNVAAFPTPEMEVRYKHLIEELRCVVCQNQALADSNADLAQDLRDEVRKMLLAGQSDQQIKDFLVQRYGDFVLYNPPLKSSTVLLWAGPIIFLILALGGMAFFIRRQSKQAPEEGKLSEAEQEKLKALLKD